MAFQIFVLGFALLTLCFLLRNTFTPVVSRLLDVIRAHLIPRNLLMSLVLSQLALSYPRHIGTTPYALNPISLSKRQWRY